MQPRDRIVPTKKSSTDDGVLSELPGYLPDVVGKLSRQGMLAPSRMILVAIKPWFCPAPLGPLLVDHHTILSGLANHIFEILVSLMPLGRIITSDL